MRTIYKFLIIPLVLFMVLLSIEAGWAQPVEETFNFTGGQQTFVVPEGVISIHIQAWGA